MFSNPIELFNYLSGFLQRTREESMISETLVAWGDQILEPDEIVAVEPQSHTLNTADICMISLGGDKMLSKKYWKAILEIALICSVIALITTATMAPSTPEPFICSGLPLVVQTVNGELNEVSLNGVASLNTLFTSGIEYNNLGYRSTDDLLYALNLTGTGYNPGLVSIIQIDSTGNIVDLGLPAGLPTGDATRFDAGDISANGNTMYISFGAQSGDTQALYRNYLYKVDLSGIDASGIPTLPLPPATNITITGDNAWVNDWAFNPNDGLLYGGDQWGTGGTSPTQLSVLNTTSGVRTDYNVAGLPNRVAGGAYGAAWFDTVRDTVFLYRNNGFIYEIDVTALTTTGPALLNTWTAPTVTRNDGTFCQPNADPSVDVEKYVSVDEQASWEDADTAPGPQAALGGSVYFKFEILNDGNVALENVTLSDSDFDFGAVTIDEVLLDGAAYASYSVVSENIEFDDPLDPDGNYTVVIGPIDTESGQHFDTATAYGDWEDTTFSDSDDAYYFAYGALKQYTDSSSNSEIVDAYNVTVSGLYTGPDTWWQITYTVENSEAFLLGEYDGQGHYYSLWDKWGGNLMVLLSQPISFNSTTNELTLEGGITFEITYEGYAAYIAEHGSDIGGLEVTMHTGDQQEKTNPSKGKGKGTTTDGRSYDVDIAWNIGYLGPEECSSVILYVAPGINPGGVLQFSSEGEYTINTGPRVRAWSSDAMKKKDFEYAIAQTVQLHVNVEQ